MFKKGDLVRRKQSFYNQSWLIFCLNWNFEPNHTFIVSYPSDEYTGCHLRSTTTIFFGVFKSKMFELVIDHKNIFSYEDYI